MDYIKLYLKIHSSNWKLYLLTALLYIPIYIVSMLVGFFLANILVPDIIAYFIAILLGGFIWSLPVLSVNRVIARTYVESHNHNKNVVRLTIKNHAISYIIYTIIFYLLPWLMQ